MWLISNPETRRLGERGSTQHVQHAQSCNVAVQFHCASPTPHINTVVLFRAQQTASIQCKLNEKHKVCERVSSDSVIEVEDTIESRS